MKLNNTFILYDRGDLTKTPGWKEAHRRASIAIAQMMWPDGSSQMRLPSIAVIEKGETYTDLRGRTVVAGKRVTLRNGVPTLRHMFRSIMGSHGWRCEKPLSLVEYFRARMENPALRIRKYPSGEFAVGLNESVGAFDFWDCTDDGFRTVIEWETGNISSSHRSLNKMSLALMGALADAAILIVPSYELYPHLTDRIGNVRELEPYFHFWAQVGQLTTKGLLAVMEVEHDELFESRDEREFLRVGPDGNSRRGKINKRSRFSRIGPRNRRSADFH